MKCSLGDELILKQIVSQSVVNQADICPKVNTFTTSNNSYTVISAFDYHFKAEKWKNPHNTNWDLLHLKFLNFPFVQFTKLLNIVQKPIKVVFIVVDCSS